MAVIMDNGVLPASKDCAAEAIYEGKVYTYNSSGRMTVATNVSATAYAVAICSSYKANGDAKTMAAGEGHPFAMLGSNMLVHCYSAISATYAVGAAVYLDAVDGAVSTASTTGTICIGTYEGMDDLVTTAVGDLVAVRLDRAPGATA
jgi:hypothetical protein